MARARQHLQRDERHPHLGNGAKVASRLLPPQCEGSDRMPAQHSFFGGGAGWMLSTQLTSSGFSTMGMSRFSI